MESEHSVRTIGTNTAVRDERALLLRDDDGRICAHADYRRDDYIFARTQSLLTRALEWESRLKPKRHWGSNAVATLAWNMFG